MSHRDIRLGTLASAGSGAQYLEQIIPHGFESFSLTFWQHIPEGFNLKKYADGVKRALDGRRTGQRRPAPDHQFTGDVR